MNECLHIVQIWSKKPHRLRYRQIMDIVSMGIPEKNLNLLKVASTAYARFRGWDSPSSSSVEEERLRAMVAAFEVIEQAAIKPVSDELAQAKAELKASLEKEEILQARILELERTARCVRCGQFVEEDRRCYAIPHCYKCLPPPPPVPIADSSPKQDYRSYDMARGEVTLLRSKVEHQANRIREWAGKAKELERRVSEYDEAIERVRVEREQFRRERNEARAVSQSLQLLKTSFPKQGSKWKTSSLVCEVSGAPLIPVHYFSINKPFVEEGDWYGAEPLESFTNGAFTSYVPPAEPANPQIEAMARKLAEQNEMYWGSIGEVAQERCRKQARELVAAAKAGK